jgi:uncharacterized membrane protein YccF (DUF307 family)
MRPILNLLWVIFGGGFIIWLEYWLAGLLLCVTVVGAPFGVQCFKIADLGLLPFGKDFDVDPAARGETVGLVMNVVWFFVAGLWIFLSHLGLAFACAATIVGIPFALQHLKLAMLALAPFGKRIEESAQ